ncbi:septum formation family protein [Schaalia canis]|uniref:Septum formation protein n=1 Tax=Schaalia canis TaxID=100469 RepID=A0A3P1SCK4_9ACTO|nr:septum formation family protein [Schaalia canis]RRC94786.1 septum formation protein [Schaalia canis]
MNVTPHRKGVLPAAIRWAFAATSVALLLSSCSQSLILHLKEGQCVNLPAEASAATIDVLPCTSAHDAEIVGIEEITENALPPESTLEELAFTQCHAHFTRYIGVDANDSQLDAMWLLPTPASWKAGDRSIVCLAVVSDDSPLTASVKDTHY